MSSGGDINYIKMSSKTFSLQYKNLNMYLLLSSLIITQSISSLLKDEVKCIPIPLTCRNNNDLILIL